MFRNTRIAACVALLTIGAAVLPGCRTGGSEAELMTSARQYVDKRDHRAAVIQLKNVLNQNPNNAEARLLLGRALLMGGDPTAALVELGKAQELKSPDEQVLPDMARAMMMLGQQGRVIEQYGATRLASPAASADLLTTVAAAHVIRNERAKAAEALAAALQAKPDHVPAIVLQGQMAGQDGRVPEALALVDKALAIAPGDERALMMRGELLWRGKNDVAGARQAFEQVLEKNPAAVAAHTSLIAMLAQNGKAEDSKAQFERMKKALPSHPETLFYDAQVAFATQDYKRSRELTDQLLKPMPENPRVLELAGAAEYRLGQFAAAETFLLRALKNNSGLTMSRWLLAQLQLRMGQPAKALEMLQPLTGPKSTDAVALALAGEAHLQMGDAAKADAAFQAAMRADPANTRVRTAVAMTQVGRGNQQAMSELEKIAAGDTSSRADLALVSARLRTGDVAGALKAADALVKKMPDRPMPLAVRGQVLLRKGDSAAARKEFETALAREPNYFPAVASLGAMDLADGRHEAARERFDAFIKAHPGNFQAWLAQAELAARSGAPLAEVTRLTREAVRANPAEPSVRLVLIEHLMTGGDAKAAVAAAQEAVTALPNNIEIAEGLGRAQMAARDAQQATTTFRRLTTQQPNNGRLHFRLAEALTQAGDNGAARTALKRALEVQPDFMPAQRALVMLSVRDKRPEEGLTLARQTQRARPQDPSGWLMEYDVESSRKNHDAAAVAMRGALQRAKTSESAVKLHNALLAGGKRAEADRWAADWLKEQPRDAAFRFYLGDAAMQRGDDAAAEAQYRAVMELQPKNALAMNNVAWLMAKQGKPGATALAERAVSMLADRPALLDTLATAQAADKQFGKAVETQKRALALQPDNAALRLNLARLYVKAGEKAYAREELDTLAKLGDKFPAQAEVAALIKSL